MRLPSRGFWCALAGVAVTMLAWIGPWSWPAWPALGLLHVAFPPERSFAALPFGVRAAIVVVVIAVNVAVWGVVAFFATAHRPSGVTRATE